MKKKILGGVAVMAVAAVAALNLNFSNNQHNLSELSLSNVEALASGESGGVINCGNTCNGAKCGTFTDNNGNSCTVYYC